MSAKDYLNMQDYKNDLAYVTLVTSGLNVSDIIRLATFFRVDPPDIAARAIVSYRRKDDVEHHIMQQSAALALCSPALPGLAALYRSFDPATLTGSDIKGVADAAGYPVSDATAEMLATLIRSGVPSSDVLLNVVELGLGVVTADGDQTLFSALDLLLNLGGYAVRNYSEGAALLSDQAGKGAVSRDSITLPPADSNGAVRLPDGWSTQ